MSKQEYDIILQAITQTCDAHQEGIRGILASIDANATVTNSELKGIRDHLKRLNGTVATLQEESDRRKKAVSDLYDHLENGSHKPWKWVKKNWWVVVGLFAFSVLIVIGLYEVFGLRGMWELLKDVK